MSGLLRRIKRSRPADAGEAHPEGRAAETQGAANPAETTSGEPRLDASEAPTQVQAPASSPSEPTGAAEGGTASSADKPGTASSAEDGATDAGATGEAPARRRWRPFRRRAKELPVAVAVPPPVLHADPNVPAGIDPAEAPMRPPAGRRGRLRRRLRYLRRARELMLRDLGGLLYEIHRTGGGNVDAHANVVGAKVQRIAGLDAEAHALETALAAPRAETVVFEPGVGGTCATCGELYGSDARFCASCGTAIGTVPESTAPDTGRPVVAEPARRAFWRRAARPAASDEAAAEPRDEGAADATEDVSATARDETPTEAAPGETAAEPRDDASADAAPEPTADEARDESPADAAHESATARDEAAADPAAEQSADEPRDDTSADEPRGDASADETTAAEPRGEATTEPAPGDESANQPRDEDATGGNEPQNPHAGARNGRPEERKAPDGALGDPLVSRERS